MKTIGIKLADGTFYPVLQEGQPAEKTLELTTAHNNQTRVMVDLYRSKTGTMEEAEYVDTLQIDHLNEHDIGDSDISFAVSLDENNELSARIIDTETGATSKTTIELVNRTLEERLGADPSESDYQINDTIDETAVEETFEETAVEEPTIEESIPDEQPFEETALDEQLFDETVTEQPSEPAKEEIDFSFDDMPDFEDNTTEEVPASAGLNFDGLYDDEPDFPDPEDEEVTKKTRVPVFICVLCAIICIVAVLLILFVIPSKLNILNKDSGKTETPAEIVEKTPEPVPEPEPVPSAKEDEIVIIEQAEEVKPEPPAQPKEEPKEISYKIKWGDTLWDIADTYYKNPWRYTKIARYNGIKNPDYIISGTVILIPQE